MSSSLSSATDQSQNAEQRVRAKATQTWKNLLGVYAEVVEERHLRERLKNEMGAAGLGRDPDKLIFSLQDADPVKALNQYQKLNPEIPLRFNQDLQPEQKYKMVAGLIKLLDPS